MRRLRAFFGFAVVSAALAGGWLWSNHTDTAGRPLLHKHVMDRRCRGGCFSSVLMWILQGGPTSAQIGAGVLTSSSGVSVTDTRASNKTCRTDSLAGSPNVVILSSNQPCVVPEGLSIEGSSTNTCFNSQDLTAANWGTSSSVGSITRTANTTDVLAPDGTNTATKLVFPATTTAGDFALVQTSSGSGHPQSGSVSMWLRGAGAQTFFFEMNNGTNSAAVTSVSLGTTWKRFTLGYSGFVGGSPLLNIGSDMRTAPQGNQAAMAAQTVYVWGVQIENTLVSGTGIVTNYIATTGTSATGAADDVRVANPLSGLNPTTWSIAATVTPLLLAGTQGVLSFGTSYAAANTANLRIAASVVNCDVYDSTGNGKNNTTTATISAGAHRLACQNNNGTITILVDGAVAAATSGGTGTGIITTMPATAMLGQIQTGGTNPLWGKMTDVCIAKTATGCF